MGAIKITKVTDYIGAYYILSGDKKSWYGIWCLSVREACSAAPMLSPWLPGRLSRVHRECKREFPSQGGVSAACSFLFHLWLCSYSRSSLQRRRHLFSQNSCGPLGRLLGLHGPFFHLQSTEGEAMLQRVDGISAATVPLKRKG